MEARIIKQEGNLTVIEWSDNDLGFGQVTFTKLKFFKSMVYGNQKGCL